LTSADHVALVTAAELSSMNIGSTVAALVLPIVLLLAVAASSLSLLLLLESVSFAVDTCVKKHNGTRLP
jgi:hypothetical protein